LVDALSLDHDLGDDLRGTGKDVVDWLDEAVQTGLISVIPRLEAHTDNAGGRTNMESAFDAIRNRARNTPSIAKPPPHMSADKMRGFLLKHFEQEGYSWEENDILYESVHVVHRENREQLVVEIVVPELLPKIDLRNALGLLLLRMKNADCKCAIAIPDERGFHIAVQSISNWVRQKIGIAVFTIDRSGAVNCIQPTEEF